jgi:hypothetical protein
MVISREFWWTNQEWLETRWGRTIDQKWSRCKGSLVRYHLIGVTSNEKDWNQASHTFEMYECLHGMAASHNTNLLLFSFAVSWNLWSSSQCCLKTSFREWVTPTHTLSYSLQLRVSAPPQCSILIRTTLDILVSHWSIRRRQDNLSWPSLWAAHFPTCSMRHQYHVHFIYSFPSKYKR